MSKRIRCIYCGAGFPKKQNLLNEHMTVCEKHPVRQADAIIRKMRSALIDFIEKVTEKDLTDAVRALKFLPGANAEKAEMVNTVQAFIELRAVIETEAKNWE